MLNEIATKRIQKEIMDLDRDPPPGITCYPKDDNITDLEAYIKGPPDSPYETGLFKLSIQIPDRYPFQPPQIKFITSIYHPNIDDSGRICADILKMGEKGEWKPAINLSTALTSLRQLLAAPNPDDPLDATIAKEYQLDYPTFFKNAQEFTTKYASEDAVYNDEEDNLDSIVNKEKIEEQQEEEEEEEEDQVKKPKMSLSLSKKKSNPSSPSTDDSNLLVPEKIIMKELTDKNNNKENLNKIEKSIEAENLNKTEQKDDVKKTTSEEIKTSEIKKSSHDTQKPNEMKKSCIKLKKKDHAEKMTKAIVANTNQSRYTPKLSVNHDLSQLDKCQTSQEVVVVAAAAAAEPIIESHKLSVKRSSSDIDHAADTKKRKKPLIVKHPSSSSSSSSQPETSKYFPTEQRKPLEETSYLNKSIILLSDDEEDDLNVPYKKPVFHSLQLSKKTNRNKLSLSKKRHS